MHTRYLLLLVGIALNSLLLPTAAIAGGIAIISHANIAPYRAAIEGFRQQLELSVEEYYLKKGTNTVVRETIQQQQPDLIFVLGRSALRFARTIPLNTPIIMAFVLHPGVLHRNESGIAMTIVPELQLTTLLTITPDIKSIGVVYNPSKSSNLMQQIRKTTDRHGIQLITTAVSTHATAAQAIQSMIPQVDAMWIMPDTTVLTTTIFRQMIRLSWRHRIPLIGLAPKHVRAGCLFALSFDSRAVGEQAGRLAQQIIHASPRPKSQVSKLTPPETQQLSINTRTAAKLGIVLTPRILQQADHTYPAHEGETFQ